MFGLCDGRVSVMMSQHVDGIRKYLGMKGECGLARQQCREAHGGRRIGKSIAWQNSKNIFWRRVAQDANMAVSFFHDGVSRECLMITHVSAWWNMAGHVKLALPA